MSKQYDYDAIIIGAGISGLVAGCYLAKAGMRTLIVEKNAKAGGYCTSFKRRGYHFDACVHSLGSFREGGNINMILKELELEDALDVKRHEPSDIIVTPDFKLHFWNDLKRTTEEFKKCFPNDSSNIEKFFDFITSCEGKSFIPLRSITFQKLLDRYFEDERLKAVLALPVLGNAGTSAEEISAVTSVLIYKEFMFDGGYYPGDSIQAFPDMFVDCFKKSGGEIFFSSLVKEVKLDGRKVEGVDIDKKGFFTARHVISNADATYTFQNLVGKDFVDEKMNQKLKTLIPSLSMFILYLGLDEDFKAQSDMLTNTNIWYLPFYDVNKMYRSAVEGDVDNLDWFLARLSSDKRSMLMLVNAPFKDKIYWKDNKERLIDLFIEKVEKVVPNLSSYIAYKDAATPNTLYRWTLNYKGAAYGWAGMPSQMAVTGFTQRTSIENMYLTGHWTTLVQGVAGVAYIGRDISKKILSRENRA